jgi:hypothetical protein
LWVETSESLVDNARTARSTLGYSLEVVRRRRLYRGNGTRTWVQYLQWEHDGLSTSEADRLQKTWRLAQTVHRELGRPLPDSRLRKPQPYAERTSDQAAARAVHGDRPPGPLGGRRARAGGSQTSWLCGSGERSADADEGRCQPRR